MKRRGGDRATEAGGGAGGAAGQASAPGERLIFAVGVASAIAILVYFAWPMILGQLYVFDDLLALHIPMRWFYAERLADGNNFIWNPYINCGYYLHGEGQVGMLHPLHLLIYSILPFTEAFNLEMFPPYPLMLAGMYLFLRRWKIRRDAAIFGALVFAFSGFNMLHFMHMHLVAIIAHIPWLLLAIDVAIRGGTRGRVAAGCLAVVVLSASEMLLGHAQCVWFSFQAEALYVLLLRPWWKGARPIVLLAAAKGIAVLIAAVQLLPTYHMLTHSTRMDPVAFTSSELSLPPVNVVQFVEPYLLKGRVITDEPNANTHEYGLYEGAGVLTLFVWLGLAAGGLKETKRLAVGAIFLAAASLVLAFGRYGGLYLLFSRLPLFEWFRASCRYIVLVDLGMAVAAAVAFDALAKGGAVGDNFPRWRWLVLLLVPAASVVIYALAAWPGAPAWGILSGRIAEGAWPATTGPLLAGCAFLLVLAAGRGSRAALAGLILFTAADLGVYGLSYMRSEPPATFEAIADSIRLPERESFFRIEAFPTTGMTATIKGFRLVTGYMGLPPAKVLDYKETGPLRLASAAYKIMKYDALSASGAGVGRLRIEAVPAPLGRARLVCNAVAAGDVKSAVARIDLETTAVVDRELALDAGPAGTAAVTSDLPGKITVTAESPGRQLLIVSESYDEGWQALVDGKSAAVMPVNGDFIGVALGGGRHEVMLEFRPRSLRTGAMVSCAGLVLAALFAGALGVLLPRRAPTG